jgi:aryl-alcohol dehydrogenase-like predicted oxidoreductase
LPETHSERSTTGAPPLFRALAREVGESAAALAHRYALSIPGVATVILGVKNRAELRECLVAAERGPPDLRLVARINAAWAAPNLASFGETTLPGNPDEPNSGSP